MGSLLTLPGAHLQSPAREEPAGLHLSDSEVSTAAGGYKRPADQLRELHDRGFSRAYIPKVGRKRVLLERDHYDAVVRGQFGRSEAAAEQERRPAPRGNLDRLKRHFSQKGTT